MKRDDAARTMLGLMRGILAVLSLVLGLFLSAVVPSSAAADMLAERSASASAALIENPIGGDLRPSGEGGREIHASAYEVAADFPLAARGVATESGFFQGTRYSQKVLEQMRRGSGELHSFPESVTAFEGAGTVRSITGGDGIVRQMLEIPGSYGGRNGVFQFIKEADGTINHRLFVPGP